MKRFMFITIGFEKPSPDDMKAWGAWFEAIGDKTVDRGGFGDGHEITRRGTKELPWGKDSMTGFVIFEARSRRQAEAIARKCPVVKSNRLYEIRDHG